MALCVRLTSHSASLENAVNLGRSLMAECSSTTSVAVFAFTITSVIAFFHNGIDFSSLANSQPARPGRATPA